MQIVPVQAIPNQEFDVLLAGQACTLRIVQRRTGLFVDLYVNSTVTPLLAGIIGLDRNLIVRDAYLGFLGDLAFVDTQGTSDPTYDGLGARFLLVYLEPGDL